MVGRHDQLTELRCGDVLADLSEYLDENLPDERRERIEAHLRGCDYCERFGREFSGAVKALRVQLGAATPIDPDVAVRLKERLRRERP
jgi:anti-sigma factor RsiW